MSRLQVTVEFHEDEIFSSFVSRLAIANNVASAREFSQHMGMQFQALVDGDRPSVERVLALCGRELREKDVRVPEKNERVHTFGNEILLRSTLSRSRLRACPHCLQEDDLRGTGPRSSRAYGRVTWLPSFVRTCSKHGLLLAPLPDPVNFGSVHDFAARVELARSRWSDFVALAAPADSSPFERYVENRLLGRQRVANWLDDFPLYVAGRLTELIGATLNHGRDFVSADLTEFDWLQAGRVGFDVTSAGPEAFQCFLRSLHDRFWERQGDFGGRLIYGRLYEMLAHENEDLAYDPIRNLIRETAVASLPIGPDHRLFGGAAARRWHSVHSATKEFGLHHKTARKMFAAAGLIPSSDETADSRTLVDALEMESFIRRWQSSLKTDAAMDRLNIGRSSWDIVLKEGYVRPLIKDYQQHGVAPVFPLDELDQFMDRLEAAAPIGANSESEYVGLPSAAKRTSSRLAQVLGLLFQGRLKSPYTEVDVRGFEGIRVSVPEVMAELRTNS